tara:strand:- start:14049 stop:14246 length:198 start_codon:yes stop_codon:yes gene_type:complete
MMLADSIALRIEHDELLEWLGKFSPSIDNIEIWDLHSIILNNEGVHIDLIKKEISTPTTNTVWDF